MKKLAARVGWGLAVFAILVWLPVFLCLRYLNWATNGEILARRAEMTPNPSGTETVYMVKRYPLHPNLSSWVMRDGAWEYSCEVQEGDFVTHAFPIREDSLDERQAQIQVATPEEKSRAGLDEASSCMIFSIGLHREIVFDHGIWRRLPRK